jgi:hypothetical protein
MKLTKSQMNETVKVTCYGKTKEYKRSDAIKFFREGIIACDPDSSECDRYENIYCQLMAGSIHASDEN